MYTSEIDPFHAVMKSHKFLFTENPFQKGEGKQKIFEHFLKSISIWNRMVEPEGTEVPVIGKSEHHLSLQPCSLA